MKEKKNFVSIKKKPNELKHSVDCSFYCRIIAAHSIALSRDECDIKARANTEWAA